MTCKTLVTLFLLSFSIFCLAQRSNAQKRLPLEKIADVPLSGGATRFDYQTLDESRGRLYIAHLGANRLIVFDTQNRRIISEVADLKSVHGVVAAPELHRVYATATGTNEVAVIDDQSFQVLARVPAGDYPNGLAYDSKDGKIYVSNNRSTSEAVIDARTNKALPGVELGGGGGNTFYDTESGHVFVVVHGVNDLAEIDPESDKVINRHHLTGVENCHSLMMDPVKRLAFVSCGGTAPKLVAFDLNKKEQMAAYPIGAQPDVLALDRELDRLYVSSESGVVTVFEVEGRGLRKLGQAYLAPDAHSVAVDQKTHLVYLPLQNLNGQPVLRILKPTDTGPPKNAVDQPLHLVKTIPLPEVQGRIDHMEVDVAGQRLFVSALGNHTLEVVDLKKGERMASLPGFHEPQGVRYLPESHTIVVANRGDGMTVFLDGNTFKPIKTVQFGSDADNVRFDSGEKRVYVGYGAGALGVLGVAGERIAEIPLGAHPESFQIDHAKGKVYVNIPTLHEIAVVDMKKMVVAARWKVTVADNNYPMALDETNQRLFVMTRRPPHLLVYNVETGKVVSTLEAGGDSDDVFFDAVRHRVYASFGDGSVMVYDQHGPDHYQLSARIATAPGARTSFFSPELGRLYVAVPHRANPSAEIRVYQAEP